MKGRRVDALGKSGQGSSEFGAWTLARIRGALPMRFPTWLRVTAPPALIIFCVVLLSPSGHGAWLIFHDGFSLEGKLKRGTTFITDPSGASFTIPAPGAFFTVDDGARSII